MRQDSNTNMIPDNNTAKNIIYTGVAGTGKTYRLLQIAKEYTHHIPPTDRQEWLSQLLYEQSWRDVICLIFLELKTKSQDLVKVPEILEHEFFVAKAAQNERDKNLSNTAWLELRRHSPVDSKTVSCENRASQAFFDKDESGAWYLLPASIPLLEELSQQLADFQQAQQPKNPHQHSPSTTIQRYTMVSFHQAYGYEEFVEGIRPVLSGSHTSGRGGLSVQTGHHQSQPISYDIQDGAFLQLCRRAAQDPEHRYAMLIDEINRANVSRVFGELLSLIEPDKRAGQPNAMQVSLAYSGRAFSIPANLDIYATMNTQDHSLAPLDMALRRRFRFIECPPAPELLPTITVLAKTSDLLSQDSTEGSTETIDLAKILIGLNRRISQVLGQETQLGHAFLLSINNLDQLQDALIEQIIPQLAQATGGQAALLQYLFNDEQQPTSMQFIQSSQSHLDEQPMLSAAAQDSIFMGQDAFVGSVMSSANTAGYRINPDLIAKTGQFAEAQIYQRLY